MMRKIVRVLGKRGRITIPYEIRIRNNIGYNDICSKEEKQMPILEKYRHYFDIDPEYFPAVNEALINSKPELWKKFFPHDTFVKLIKNTVSVLDRKQKLSIWVEGV